MVATDSYAIQCCVRKNRTRGVSRRSFKIVRQQGFMPASHLGHNTAEGLSGKFGDLPSEGWPDI